MTTDNRTNEPTPEQILAALNAYSSKGLEIDGYDPVDEYPSLDMWGERFASQMRAALEAAGVASQEVIDDAADEQDDLRMHMLAPQPVFDEAALAEVIADAPHSGDPNVSCLDPRCKAAAVAAWLREGVAPQEPSGVTDANGHSWMSWEESGKNGTYCRSCGGWAGKVGNRQCSPAPVLPSSGVDEDALAEVIGNLDWGYMVDGPSVSEIARAVVEWLKGQGNAARE